MEKSQKKSETSHEITPFWRGWSDLDRVFDSFRRDFERSLTSFPAISIPTFSTSTLACDLIDEGEKFIVNTEMPGVKKEDIKLNVTDNAIEISAEHKEEEEEKKKNFLRKERKQISYHRALSFPEKVDSAKAKAKLSDGVLNIEVPKVTPTPKPKSVSIQIQ